jgi:hypothetical protein
MNVGVNYIIQSMQFGCHGVFHVVDGSGHILAIAEQFSLCKLVTVQARLRRACTVTNCGLCSPEGRAQSAIGFKRIAGYRCSCFGVTPTIRLK